MSAAIEVPFVRTKRGKADAFTSVRADLSRQRPWRVGQMLAIAHAMRQLFDEGLVREYAELAAILGVTRPRVTQLLDLTLLAPDIQEEILFGYSTSGREHVSEKALRGVVRALRWSDQRRKWEILRAR
jgi:hypothetical protein